MSERTVLRVEIRCFVNHYAYYSRRKAHGDQSVNQCQFKARKGVLRVSDKVNHLTMEIEIFNHVKCEGKDIR